MQGWISQSINFSLTCGQQWLLVPNQLTASMATTCCVQLFDAFLLLSILATIWCISLTQYPRWSLRAIVSGAKEFLSQKLSIGQLLAHLNKAVIYTAGWLFSKKRLLHHSNTSYSVFMSWRLSNVLSSYNISMLWHVVIVYLLLSL